GDFVKDRDFSSASVLERIQLDQEFSAHLCTKVAFLERIENMTPRPISSSKRDSSLIGLKVSGALAALFALLAVAVGTFQPPNVGAYALEGPRWPNGSTVVMQLSLGNAGRTLTDGNTSWNAAVSPALDSWNAVIGGMQFGRV